MSLAGTKSGIRGIFAKKFTFLYVIMSLMLFLDLVV